MYIEFSYIDGLALPENKKLKLVEGIVLLERQNKECTMSGDYGSVNYRLYFTEEDEIDVFGGMLDFPMDTFNFPLLVEEELTADGGELTPEIEDFLTTLYKSVKQKPQRKKKLRPEKQLPIEKEEKPEPIQSETANKAVVSPSKKAKPEKKRISFHVSKKIVIGISVFFLCLLLGVLGMRFGPQLFAEQTPSYEELMKAGNFMEAGKIYTNRQDEIEQTLYEKALDKQTNQSKKNLDSFQSKYPTDFGAFDLAILGKNYTQALTLYAKNKKVFKQDTDRMTLVGYCYLKEDQPKEAKEVSKATRSVELEKYVYQYEQYVAQINEYEKQLEELKKDPVKNRDKIEKTLNDLFDAKEALVNL